MSDGATTASESRPGRAGGTGASERDNVRVWDGRRGHYEVWYLTLNHRASHTGFWIRYTLEAPRHGHGEPYAQLWFAAFDATDPARGFALNRRLPVGELRSSVSPFELRVGEAVLRHGEAAGALSGAGHSARWDLRWEPAGSRTLRQLPELVYRTGLGDTKVLSPHPDIAIRGTIDLDGRRLLLDGEPGGQTHLWGKKHAHSWAWGHCNAFEGRPGAVLEALSIRLARRGFVLPPLTLLTLVLEGEPLRFTHFSDLPFTRGAYGTGRYDFCAVGADVRVEGGFACRPEDMVLASYTDPDGEQLSCANTEVADLRLTVHRRSGWLGRWVEQARLVAPDTGHFEVAGRCVDPAILRRHVAV